VRPRGIDFAAGSTLLPSGMALTASAIAAAAAAGLAKLNGARQPRLASLAGGDDIAAPGAQAEPSQIFDCVSYGVAGFAQGWGAAAQRGPLLRDDAAAIARVLTEVAVGADMTIVIGGASVGDHDYTRRAAQALGAEILFDKIAVRPGKPTWLAVRDHHVILGLPGNPASALVCARLLLRPFVAAMLGGDVTAATATRRARLAAPLAANGPRESYLRASTHIDAAGQLCVTPAADQDSSLISVFVGADALVACAPEQAAMNAGETVDILPL
ncbi:MAG: molybdopterin molybdenumtransferase MoeA, partial [Proteobacteria bacterium]|nr:molybdopterin molybdenumtransferase MoeA [Pseudomonadota bacterium]